MAVIPTNILPLLGIWPGGDLGPYTIYTTRRRGVVWFPRSPPKQPPSYLQRRHRNSWRFAARAWTASTATIRQAWRDAAQLAHLSISGYNLFIFWQVSKNRSIIETVQRQSGITLL